MFTATDPEQLVPVHAEPPPVALAVLLPLVAFSATDTGTLICTVVPAAIGGVEITQLPPRLLAPVEAQLARLTPPDRTEGAPLKVMPLGKLSTNAIAELVAAPDTATLIV